MRFVSLSSKAIKEYFTGEQYWIQPIQLGRSYLFFKYPEKSSKGSVTIGVTVERLLVSFIMLPKNIPSEFPAKPVANEVK